MFSCFYITIDNHNTHTVHNNTKHYVILDCLRGFRSRKYVLQYDCDPAVWHLQRRKQEIHRVYMLLQIIDATLHSDFMVFLHLAELVDLQT